VHLAGHGLSLALTASASASNDAAATRGPELLALACPVYRKFCNILARSDRAWCAQEGVSVRTAPHRGKAWRAISKRETLSHGENRETPWRTPGGKVSVAVLGSWRALSAPQF